MRIAAVLAVLSLLAGSGSAETLHVPGDHTKIQEAIDAAKNGDTVLVAPGTYVENIDFLGKAIIVKSAQNPEDTVIDGGQAWSTVSFANNESSASVLDGFLLRNGSNLNGGGGIYCHGSSPVVMNNIIAENKAWWGGGICCFGASPTIKNNTITLNKATGVVGCGGGVCLSDCDAPIICDNTVTSNKTLKGGGIFCTKCGSVMISGNVISENSVTEAGGGIYCTGSDAAICGNIILDNSARDWCGGGIYFKDNSTSFITNNVIAGNEADCAGGIAFLEHADLEAVNNTVTGNKAASKGGAIYCDAFSGPFIANTILWNNTAPQWPEIFSLGTLTVTFCDIKAGYPGTGNINKDPLFVDPAGSDFHLAFPSPCRDAGDDLAVKDPLDFEGDPRIAYGAVDMGADEFHTHLYWTGDATPGGNVKMKFTGLPGTAPVRLWLGSGLLDPPWPTQYGDWHLQFPLLVSAELGAVPSTGVSVLPFVLPPAAPVPLSLPFQAGIGTELTNPTVMNVE